MAQPNVTTLMEPGEPKPDDYPIQIFLTKMPEYKYEEMALIEIGDTSDEWCIKKIKEQARKMGADAAIVLGKAGSYSVGSATATTGGGYSTLSGVSAGKGYGMTAMAIKRLDNEDSPTE